MSNRNKFICFLVLALSLFFMASCDMGGNGGGGDQPVTTDKYFQRIDVVSDAMQYEKLELALYEKELKIADNYNPFDYNQIKVVIEFTSPSGVVTKMPAFWYQATQTILNTSSPGDPYGISGEASKSKSEPQGTEVVTAIGDPHYRVRFLPEEAGTYKYVVKVFINGVLNSTENEKTVDIAASNEVYKGLLKVDETTNRNFCFTNTNETYVTIGENACWYTSSTRKTEDYGVWFKKMQENSMNTTRIWLATWGFCLHWSKYNDYTNRYAAIARLDKMFEYADEYDIRFMLCLNNHGQFSTQVNAEWDKNPYNEANGGPLDSPQHFFTSETAKTAYKNELLYLIARYSYSDKILCWELFNEVDWIDGFSVLSVYFKRWHQEMATFLNDNDPYGHMVATSFKGTDGNANALEEMDFVSPHDYSYTNKNTVSSISGTQQYLFEKYNKPVFFGEIGVNGSNGISNYNLDPNGITIHLSQWGGMMTGGAGGAMNWWWDSYVHPYNLYGKFKGAGIYAKEMNLHGSDYELLEGKASTNSGSLNIYGYHFNNRVYGYIIDKNYTYYNTSLIDKTNVNLSGSLSNGTYSLRFYDTDTGEVISSQVINITNGQYSVTIPTFKYDIAYIIDEVK